MSKKLIIKKDNELLTLLDEKDIQDKLDEKLNANDAFSGDYNDLINKPNSSQVILINSRKAISSDGIYFYAEPPLTVTVEGNNITFFQNGYVEQFNAFGGVWLYGSGNVIVNWGDGSTDTIVRDESISHTYTDGLSSHDVTFHGDINTIGTVAFAGCPISKVIIPSEIEEVSFASFYESDVQDVIINSKYIGDQAFYECSALENVEINNARNINYNSFANCTSLTSISIPSSAYLENDIFENDDYIIDYQLYWTNDDIIYWTNDYMPINENTIFTIPYGETQNYIDHDYPEELLVERS